MDHVSNFLFFYFIFIIQICTYPQFMTNHNIKSSSYHSIQLNHHFSSNLSLSLSFCCNLPSIISQTHLSQRQRHNLNSTTDFMIENQIRVLCWERMVVRKVSQVFLGLINNNNKVRNISFKSIDSPLPSPSLSHGIHVFHCPVSNSLTHSILLEICKGMIFWYPIIEFQNGFF
jgi:hypothetical protein